MSPRAAREPAPGRLLSAALEATGRGAVGAHPGGGGVPSPRRGALAADVRSGASLLEAMTAVLAGAVACACMAALLHADERLAEARARRLARLETIRIADGVLRRELSVADPAADLDGAGRDSVALRLFRGLVVVCGATADGRVLAAYAGEREPDPVRDSLLPLSPAGAVALPLRAASRAPAPCPAAAAATADPLTSPGAPPPAVGGWYALDAPAAATAGTAFLLFQHSTYALSDAALRVRHGAEGRQPLTGEWLENRRTTLVLRAGHDPTAARVEVTLAFTFAGGMVRLRLPLPNTLAPAAGAPRP